MMMCGSVVKILMTHIKVLIAKACAYNVCIENAVTSFLGDPLPISFYGRCFHGQSKYRQLPHILRQFILIDRQRDGVFLTAIWPAQVSAFIGALSVPCIHANRLPNCPEIWHWTVKSFLNTEQYQEKAQYSWHQEIGRNILFVTGLLLCRSNKSILWLMWRAYCLC